MTFERISKRHINVPLVKYSYSTILLKKHPSRKTFSDYTLFSSEVLDPHGLTTGQKSFLSLRHIIFLRFPETYTLPLSFLGPLSSLSRLLSYLLPVPVPLEKGGKRLIRCSEIVLKHSHLKVKTTTVLTPLRTFVLVSLSSINPLSSCEVLIKDIISTLERIASLKLFNTVEFLL